ncbi:adenosylcobinamide-phosphate synthase CbiB [Citromicrobium bathyomarinum]
MADPVLAAAMALDAALGWPGWLYRRVGHPVGGFARIISASADILNRADRSVWQRRLGGVATVLAVIAAAGGVAWAAQAIVWQTLGENGWPVVAILAFPAIAQRSLIDHVRAVSSALAAGDLPAARQAVAMIVGRDTAALDEAGVARAAIESLAESFCDGVIAPIFWFAFLGLPGVWMFKAINTADSMIGHIEEPWRDFGWAAARIDDAANFVPARLAAILICLAGLGGWRIMWCDHARHASPNAGWPEAAMAGALGVRLAGPISYDGVGHDKPFIGSGGEATPGDLRRGIRIVSLAWLITLIIAGAFAWLA